MAMFSKKSRCVGCEAVVLGDESHRQVPEILFLISIVLLESHHAVNGLSDVHPRFILETEQEVQTWLTQFTALIRLTHPLAWNNDSLRNARCQFRCADACRLSVSQVNLNGFSS